MLNLDKKPHMAKNEFQFMQFVIKPLWVAFNDFTADAISVGVKNIENNIKRWEQIYKEALLEEEQMKKNAISILDKEDKTQEKKSPEKALETSKSQDQSKEVEETKSKEKAQTEKA